MRFLKIHFFAETQLYCLSIFKGIQIDKGYNEIDALTDASFASGDASLRYMGKAITFFVRGPHYVIPNPRFWGVRDLKRVTRMGLTPDTGSYQRLRSLVGKAVLGMTQTESVMYLRTQQPCDTWGMGISMVSVAHVWMDQN